MSDELLIPPTTDRRRGIVRLLAIALGLAVVYAVLPIQEDSWWVGVLVAFVVVVAIVPVTVRRVNAIATSSRPLFAAAEAIVIVVAMLVFAFSTSYLAINRSSGQFTGLETKVDAVYFTITTLSTVGYGDIHASGQLARIVVTLQMLADVTVLALSVRTIVGTARQRRSAGGAPVID